MMRKNNLFQRKVIGRNYSRFHIKAEDAAKYLLVLAIFFLPEIAFFLLLITAARRDPQMGNFYIWFPKNPRSLSKKFKRHPEDFVYW